MWTEADDIKKLIYELQRVFVVMQKFPFRLSKTPTPLKREAKAASGTEDGGSLS